MELKLTILYDPQQIYLHLLIQDQNSSNNYQNILNYINYIFHELLFMLRLQLIELALGAAVVSPFHVLSSGQYPILTFTLMAVSVFTSKSKLTLPN